LAQKGRNSTGLTSALSIKWSCPLVTADDRRRFACVADAVRTSRTDRLSAGAPHFIGDVAMQALLGTLD
jgi:hypothetical protein